MTQINLLPWREQARQAKKIRLGIVAGITVGIAIVVNIIIHLLMLSSIHHQQSRTAFLQTELSAVGGVLVDLNRKKREQDAVISELNFIYSMRKKSYNAIILFDTLVKVVPDAISFNKIIRENNTITITGKSSSNLQITQLMKNITGINIFKQPDLKEIIGKENVSGDERLFQIKVEQTE